MDYLCAKHTKKWSKQRAAGQEKSAICCCRLYYSTITKRNRPKITLATKIIWIVWKIRTLCKYYPTWAIPEDSIWIQEAASAYENVLDKKPKIDKWTFSTNGVAIAGMHGIPCVGMGPGNEVLAHAPNEHCPVEHLSQSAAFYAGYVAKLNGK